MQKYIVEVNTETHTLNPESAVPYVEPTPHWYNPIYWGIIIALLAYIVLKDKVQISFK